ncbi:ABC transporter substrate-binding protein [Microbacterium sp. STN6]|uniref:ABC transporter substrate-binding protein n=1 Tax=Microbacterium sp. STN6 TaxID=2995588 RepID=UPI0022609E63|nr:ABC transporter substrate-binding protein [Microbacterium sp. STN6]MCX7522700.1 ABC transporter substrate-binding protein [Microbacterium sp. STN6]
MFRWKRLTAVAAVVALGLTGCSAAGGDSSSDTASQTLNLGVIVPATTFSAADANWANESPYMQAVYDTVLKADPDGTVEPNLATKWSYNSDKTELTLTLRTDVKFTDGTKLDADAVAQNLLRFRDGVSPNKSLLASLKDATAVDDKTVKLTLTDSDPALLTSLTQNAGLIESPKAFSNKDLKTNPVGSGPYTLDTKKTVVGTSYVFEKNTKYWNPSAVHYGTIVMKVYQDPTAMLNAIKGGQVNAANTPNNNSIDEIKASGFTIVNGELNWEGLLLFDRGGTMNPALGNVKVRQAINYAFDRPALLKTIGQGYGTVTEQIFPPSSVGFDKSLDTHYTYDVKKAKELMAEAGYADGFTLNMPSSAFFGTAPFSLLQQQLKEIGITVKYTDPGNNFIPDVLAPKYPAILMVLQQDPTDWQLINFQIAPKASWNPFHYEDPKVNEFIDTIHHGSKADSDAAVKDLNAYLVDQAWFAPWFRPASNFTVDGNTAAVFQTGNAVPYLWNIKPKS